MAEEPQMMMANGQPTRKMRYQGSVGAPTGIGTGAGLALILGWYISKYQPDMPEPIVAIAAGILSGVIVAVAMWVVGWVTRPSKRDTIKVDPATTGERIGPPPGIPPAD